jgi:hypothetical protein
VLIPHINDEAIVDSKVSVKYVFRILLAAGVIYPYYSKTHIISLSEIIGILD